MLIFGGNFVFLYIKTHKKLWKNWPASQKIKKKKKKKTKKGEKRKKKKRRKRRGKNSPGCNPWYCQTKKLVWRWNTTASRNKICLTVNLFFWRNRTSSPCLNITKSVWKNSETVSQEQSWRNEWWLKCEMVQFKCLHLNNLPRLISKIKF